ncbi:MAG: MraY family glycosyltransferase [bacterium]
MAFLITPLFGRLSFRLGVIDHPSRRKFHLTSMPMMGGFAVAFSFLALLPIALGWNAFREFSGIILASLVLMGFGFVDDVRGISPIMKLAGQSAGTIILIASGLMWRITGIYPLDILITFIWVCGIINAMNLLDNIDGLSSGTAAITAVFFYLIAVLHGADQFAFLPIILAGACIGFLFHNFHPASIFLGDAGSMFIGTLIAAFGMVLPRSGDALTHLVSAVVVGLLILDTGLVSILRLTNRRRLSRGGKDHTSHRLCALGLSVQSSVIVLFAANFFFGFCAIFMLKIGTPKGLIVPFGLFMLGLMCIYLLKDTYDYGREGA